MNRQDNKKSGWKEVVKHEVREMAIIFIYLSLFFCTFTLYRQLVVSELGIAYWDYGFVLVKALIFAKVILLGKLLPITRIYDNKALVIPTIYKVALFSVFAILFEILEQGVGSLIHGKEFREVFVELKNIGWSELLSRVLLMTAAFMPFFAFEELDRVLGAGTLQKLFMKKNDGQLVK
ncbi:MAG: hypothetical protein U5K54_13720 [Cytophagales bacterium]|nr:hypothetical protein [Cytophagales bacterium]